MSQTPTIPARSATELRRAFLDFFREREHAVVPSSPLVPNDPTLLFTTAGMVQFKPYYTAGDDVPYTRAVSIQKCLRLTDLERVGLTPRHDTFFEMLGNFSFGPKEKGAYFKQEAIAWGWEFVTKVLGLPAQRLYCSIFAGEGNLPRDDEAAALWKHVGVAEDHVVALGRADNFWGPAGGQGACGPCSEIYFDLGEKRPPDLPAGEFWGEAPGDAGDRFMEFWNLVFPQFDAQADGSLQPLARPGIDTGMGLERLAMIQQGRLSIFETDVFAPLVGHVLGLSRAGAGNAGALRDARIIADHMRALTFAIAEGALPGNEGAGYVLRRLLRRAITRGRSRQGLAIVDTPLLADAARLVCDRFGDHYTELRTRRDAIVRVLEQEEAAFIQTFESGRQRLEQLLTSSGPISGADAFALHDTYGFPFELTEEIARERGATVDRDGFEAAMEDQRRRARETSKFKKGDDGPRGEWTILSSGPDSEFVGYDRLDADGLTLRRWRSAGDEALELVLDRTPCYAEQGGQVADRGWLTGGGVAAALSHVYKEGDSIVHRVALAMPDRDRFVAAATAGRLAANVDPEHRRPTLRHHTATHLLHAALRQVLGDHVRQAGSLVAPDRLRFDYAHFEHPTHGQLESVARFVNEWVLSDRPVTWAVMPIDDAKRLGAMALFGEKYGAQVRVVTVEGVPDANIPPSRELCGGTHVSRTGEIGAFVIVSDASIASGVRRIEALAGHEALRWLRGQSDTLHQIAASLQTSADKLPDQIAKLRSRTSELEGELVRLASGTLEKELDAQVDGAAISRPSSARWFVYELKSSGSPETLRGAADRTMGVLGRGAFVVALHSGGKLTFMAAVHPDLVAEKRLNASDLVRKVAQVTGGSGGGKPHLALAGGKDLAKLADALAEARRLLQEALG
jgi:alanyl-tRNA synthetase